LEIEPTTVVMEAMLIGLVDLRDFEFLQVHVRHPF
jgi:hypothetical protein